MKKGFTLMEILAVLLVIAVVVSMAVPVFRSVRYEIKNSQAKKAAKAMAEAMRTYYQVSRGLGIQTSCFTPTKDTSTIMASSCASPSAEGIKKKKNTTVANSSRSPISQLFACGYLSYKDFVNVPYQFCACSTVSGCTVPGATSTDGPVLVRASGDASTGAGNKYSKNYYIYVDRSMRVKDTEDDE